MYYIRENNFLRGENSTLTFEFKKFLCIFVYNQMEYLERFLIQCFEFFTREKIPTGDPDGEVHS